MINRELKNIDDIRIPFLKNSKCYLGVSGSSLSGNLLKANDIDLILVLPDNSISEEISQFPNYYDVRNWEILKSIKSNTSDYIFSVKNLNIPKIKIEIYTESLVNKILSFQKVVINRIKELKKNKEEVFFNQYGETIKRPLVSFEKLSKTSSFLDHNNQIFWGMHFERLILSKLIKDSLGFSAKRKKSIIVFKDLIGDKINLNNLFYCTSKNELINLESLIRL